MDAEKTKEKKRKTKSKTKSSIKHKKSKSTPTKHGESSKATSGSKVSTEKSATVTVGINSSEGQSHKSGNLPSNTQALDVSGPPTKSSTETTSGVASTTASLKVPTENGHAGNSASSSKSDSVSVRKHKTKSKSTSRSKDRRSGIAGERSTSQGVSLSNPDSRRPPLDHSLPREKAGVADRKSKSIQLTTGLTNLSSHGSGDDSVSAISAAVGGLSLTSAEESPAMTRESSVQGDNTTTGPPTTITAGTGSEKWDRVLQGNMSDLPPMSSKIVRIFTSSTFTDTSIERNALMEEVYPQLKKYCREKHGLEFQVVDMRWGVRDEATDDHMTTSLCLKEIENCQRLSVGPNFIVLLGNKYGFRPIPTFINAEEFERIRLVPKLSSLEVEMLDRWYKCDMNKVPPEYVLQPISSILINFCNKRMPSLQEQDQNTWWDTMMRMQRTFRKAAQYLFTEGVMTDNEMHNYFMSVTEREIIKGVLTTSDPQNHCLGYIRALTNINTNSLRCARNYIDFLGHRVDQEAQHLLEKLKNQRLPRVLPEANTSRFTVAWQEQGGMVKEGLKDYLMEFCYQFYNGITKLIDEGVERNNQISRDPVFAEILQHLHACNNFCQVFQGRNDIIERLQSYIKNPENREMMVIFGESGCGKTSVLAKGASMAGEWLREAASSTSTIPIKPVLVVRFLGTSPDSSTLIPLLTSLSRQIANIYRTVKQQQQLEAQQEEALVTKTATSSTNSTTPAKKNATATGKFSPAAAAPPKVNLNDPPPTELSQLLLHFRELLAIATPEVPLLLFIDSLDQISGVDSAHLLYWLPERLPPNVKLVVSTLPNYYDLLVTLRKKVTVSPENNFYEIRPMGQDLSLEIIESWLTSAKEAITPAQWTIVKEALGRCNLPLFVKIVFEEVCRWRSYYPEELTRLTYTIQESINNLFQRIENQHGKELVIRALAYITASKSGISEAELEDVLSLDEKVLNDVYQYHLPPVRRIPPLLWTRIRNDLPGYLSEREADGIIVIHWYHRQFIDVARNRYFRNLNFEVEIHAIIADYYLGRWAGVPKPFEYDELQKTRFALDSTRSESDRRVPPQPFCLTSTGGTGVGGVVRYNLRKINELPFHLIKSRRYQEFFDECIFNLDFLYSKLSGMTLQALLQDMRDLLVVQESRDTEILIDTLRLAASVITRHPDMIGPQVTGRLLPYYSSCPYIRRLIQQSDSEGLHRCALVPAYHYLHTPGGPLEFSLEGHLFAPYGIQSSFNGRYVMSVSNQFIVWDLITGETFRANTPQGLSGIMRNLILTPCDRYSFSYSNSNQIVRCDLSNGECKVWPNPLLGNLDAKDEEIIGMVVAVTLIVIWTRQYWAIINCFTGEVVKVARLPKELNWNLMRVEIREENGENHIMLVTQAKDDPEINEIFLVDDDNFDNSLKCHHAMVLTRDGKTLYACGETEKHSIIRYYRETLKDPWIHKTTFENSDLIYSLMLSQDQTFLVATVLAGYKLWRIQNTWSLTQKGLFLSLPTGLRNIPPKYHIVNTLTFTQNNAYMVVAHKKNLYAYSTKLGSLSKVFDAHFGRVIGLCGVSESNKVVSSSMDKTVKVWNFNNIAERVFSINRMERPIDDISLATESNIGAMRTRNEVGIWNLNTGKLISTLSSGRSAIISYAYLLADASILITAEQKGLFLWSVEKNKSIKVENQTDAYTLLVFDNESRCVCVSKVEQEIALVKCRTLPEFFEIYSFQYAHNVLENGNFVSPVITSDDTKLIIVAPNKEKQESLQIYNANTGAYQYCIPIKIQNFHTLIAISNDGNHVALIQPEKGTIYDIRKKSSTPRIIARWNGIHTNNGKFGLYAPARGGLELIDLKKGNTVHVLIPKIAEGVFTNRVFFTSNNNHVVYYHSGHRSIRVFRVADGKCLATYWAHAEVKVICGTPDGYSVVLGAEDGSVTVLTIGDPEIPANLERLATLTSRQEDNDENISAINSNSSGIPSSSDGLRPSTMTMKKRSNSVSIQTTGKIAQMVAKHRMNDPAQSNSKLCVLS